MTGRPQVRRFTPRVTDGSADADTVAWTRAMVGSFLGPRLDPAQLARAAAAYDGDRLRAVDDNGSVVATLRSFDATMTVPGGELPVHGITAIGVRATHRRRGMVRALLDDDLAEATRAGTPVAALTSTQGALYERWGFGAASWTRSLTLDTRRASFRDTTIRGQVSLVEPADWAGVLGPVAQRARRRHPGSMSRPEHSWRYLADGPPWAGSSGSSERREAALWSDASGTPGGYVIYRVARGWYGTGAAELAILDLQATTPESYRELWRHLCSLDLVGSVTWDDASVDEPLRWLLDDPRACSAGAGHDMLWLRVLDASAALTSRTYPVADRIRVRVHDAGAGSVGSAAGSWLLDTHDRTAPSVSALGGGEVDVEMPASTLGALYLGGPDPRVLARAGRLTEHSPGAAGRLARLFAAPTVPWNGMRF